MSRFWIHPLTHRALYATAMVKAFLKFRNPRRIRSGKHLDAFHHQMWSEAAANIGGTFTALGPHFGEVALGTQRTRVMGNVSAIDDPVTLAIAHDKALVHEMLTRNRLPVPTHCAFTQRSIRKAAEFLDAASGPCVVKPAAGTGGGRGVTTGITRLSHLARAAAAAAVYSDELLIERQVDGDNYRLLYLDGALIDAFYRKSPQVVGDGRSTVAKLVDAVNENRLRQETKVSQVLISIDQDMHRTLEAQQLTLRSVPAAGKTVILKRVVNENGGCDNTTALRLSPSVVEAGAAAVKALRLRFGGVDIVTPDAARPLAQVGGVILEVNGTPNLYYHYHKSDGRVPVATMLLERLFGVDSPADQSSNIDEAWRSDRREVHP